MVASRLYAETHREMMGYAVTAAETPGNKAEKGQQKQEDGR
jgi:hypothetical protein